MFVSYDDGYVWGDWIIMRIKEKIVMGWLEGCVWGCY